MPAGISLTPKAHLMTADEIVTIAQTFVNQGKNQVDWRRAFGSKKMQKISFCVLGN
jgi:hypothetical protein